MESTENVGGGNGGAQGGRLNTIVVDTDSDLVDIVLVGRVEVTLRRIMSLSENGRKLWVSVAAGG